MSWLSENSYRPLTLSDSQKMMLTLARGDSFQRYVVLTFDDGYASLENAFDIMSDYGFVGTCFAISDFIGKENSWDYQFGTRRIQHAGARFLRKLIDAGWEVGSHSRRHPHLGRLSSEFVNEELLSSKEKISALTGAAVRSISYPFGYADKHVCAIARKCGYECGVGLGLPLRRQLPLGRMCLPRLGIYLFDTRHSFARKLKAFTRYKRSSFFMQQLISYGTKGTILLKKWKPEI